MEEEHYDVIDTYIATVKKAKTGKCEICQDTYEKEINDNLNSRVCCRRAGHILEGVAQVFSVSATNLIVLSLLTDLMSC